MRSIQLIRRHASTLALITVLLGLFAASYLIPENPESEVFRTGTLGTMLMLLCYSLGLGVPFLLSALLLDQLRGAFNWIKRNYRAINIICGCLLILIGVLMATGLFGMWISLLS